MRILIAHSFYRLPGGEDRYVRQQVDLLGERHSVELIARENETLAETVRTASTMTLSVAERRSVGRAVSGFRPDVIHLHNAYPSLGPAVHLVAERRGLPLVQTVHNFRLRCPNGLMFTEGAPCRRCEGGNYANAIVHDCFPTRTQAAGYAGALWAHRFILELERKVTLFVAPSQFMRGRLIEWGISTDRIEVIPNFTDFSPGNAGPGMNGLYLGRISAEKGLDVLLHALAQAGDPPFHFVGDGPDASDLKDLAAQLGLRRTRFLGLLDRQEVELELRSARFVAITSKWDENAPLAAIEAMTAGRPLLVTRTGGLTELVEGGGGEIVEIGDATATAVAIARLMDDDDRCRKLGEQALDRAISNFAPAVHRARLEALYQRAMELMPRSSRRAVAIETAIVNKPIPGQDSTTKSPPTSQHPSATRSILMAHCYYRDLGGENLSFEAEAQLLVRHGQRVSTYIRDNREIDRLGHVGRAGLAVGTVWADDSYAAITRLIKDEQPQVVHFQNTFPLISPAGFYAAKRGGAAVVQALRNYRALCANGLFFRDGHVCEDCLGQTIPWPALSHACYRGSRPASGVVVAMQTTHNVLGTWKKQVDLYIAPSEFSRSKYIEAGIPETRIVTKPNFVYPDPGVATEPGRFALFAGRLEIEKGILTLLEAWRRVRSLPLKVAGDGPLRAQLVDYVERHQLTDRVELLGYQSQERVLALMKQASFAIFPSEWYETFGRVATEAYACGVPVLASQVGAIVEIVADGRTGLHFMPGDADDLAEKVEWMEKHPDERAAMGREARAEFENKYTAAHNFRRLMEIYDQAIAIASVPDGG